MKSERPLQELFVVTASSFRVHDFNIPSGVEPSPPMFPPFIYLGDKVRSLFLHICQWWALSSIASRRKVGQVPLMLFDNLDIIDYPP